MARSRAKQQTQNLKRAITNYETIHVARFSQNARVARRVVQCTLCNQQHLQRYYPFRIMVTTTGGELKKIDKSEQAVSPRRNFYSLIYSANIQSNP